MKYFLLLLLGGFTSSMMANETNELENLFDEVTQESRDSNLNIDYQGSSLSVLYTKDLELMGIRSLSEALDFIPGIEVNITPYGNDRIVMRGASNPHNAVAQSVRFYIDGVDIEYIYYANFPIELIQRIEVSRSPSIARYGQGSFSGSVNIVTKSSLKNTQGFINAEYGSFNTKKVSSLFQMYQNGITIGVDAHYQKHNKKVDAPNAKDTIVTGISAASFPRARESLEGLKDKGIGLSIYNDTWRFTSRYLQTFTQNYYGTFGLLDFNEDGYTKYTTFDTQVSYKDTINSSLKIHSNIGFLSNGYELNTYLYLLDPNTISPAFKNPHYQMDFRKEIYFSDIGLQSDYFTNHLLDFGINLKMSKIVKNDYYTNADVNSQVGFLLGGVYYPVSDTLTKLDGSSGIVNVPNNEQKSISYYLQDVYTFNEALDFNINLRYDDYEFFSEKTSYKLASVYSQDNQNIFKFSYAYSYRMPSAQEAFLVDHFLLVGTSTLEPESIESYEVGYTYKGNKENLNVNFYYNIYRDTIELNDVAIDYYYNNPDKQYSRGIEFEYDREFKNHSKLLFNASYTNFKYINKAYFSANTNTPDASPYMISAGYILPLSSRVVWTNSLHYKSKKNLSASTSTIPSSVLIDTTLNYIYKKNLTMNFKVKNVFDKKHYYPAVGIGFEPMLREGRTMYLSLKYSL